MDRPAKPSLAPAPASTSAFPDPIPGILPFETVNLFSGPSGVGKTVIKAQWAAAFLRGDPILGIPTNRPTALYYLAADRPWHPTYAATFAAAGLTAADLTVYCLMDPDSGYDPRTLRAGNFSAFDFFDQCLDKLAPLPGGLVFVDPLAPLFIAGNQNIAKDVAIALQWIRRCAQRRGITLVCDANVAKLKADEDFQRPQDRISGSGAFLAYSDTVFNFVQEAVDPTIRTLTWQPRRAAAGRQQFVFDDETSLLVPYTGQLKPDEPLPPELLLVLDAFPPVPETLSYEEVLDLIMQICMVQKTQAKARLTDLQTSGQLLRPIHGRYSRARVA